MSTKKLVKNLLSVLVISLLTTLLSLNTLSSSSYAQETSLSLGFSPTSVSLKLQPGESYSGQVAFWNLAPRTTTFDVNIAGFEQIEDYPGTSRILTDQEETNSPYSASKWFFVEQKTVEIRPNSQVSIPFTVTVPDDAASGEHHAMIFLLSRDDERGNAPGSQALTDLGSGPAILIHVGDELIETATLNSFTSDKEFYEKTPTLFLTNYENKGNTHITPAGDIVLYNFLGQEIDRISFNESRRSILRDQVGMYEDTWNTGNLFLTNGKISIGPIEAKLITTYRSVNPGFAPLSATTSFWILPWKHILAILVILFLLYNRTLGKKLAEKSKKR